MHVVTNQLIIKIKRNKRMSNNNVKFVERKRNGIQPITASQVKNIAKIIFSLNPYEK